MNENIIAVNIPNAVSITVMAVVGFILLSLGGKWIASRQGGG